MSDETKPTETPEQGAKQQPPPVPTDQMVEAKLRAERAEAKLKEQEKAEAAKVAEQKRAESEKAEQKRTEELDSFRGRAEKAEQKLRRSVALKALDGAHDPDMLLGSVEGQIQFTDDFELTEESAVILSKLREEKPWAFKSAEEPPPGGSKVRGGRPKKTHGLSDDQVEYVREAGVEPSKWRESPKAKLVMSMVEGVQ